MKYIVWGLVGTVLAALILPFIKEEFVIKESTGEIEAPLDYEK